VLLKEDRSVCILPEDSHCEVGLGIQLLGFLAIEHSSNENRQDSNGRAFDWIGFFAAQQYSLDSITHTQHERKNKMRVLFAGLNLSFVQSLKFYLAQHRHDLKVVNNGIGCMFTLKNHSIDLLVVEQDLLWGGADGVLSLMREDPDLQEIPAVMLTTPNDHDPVRSVSKSRIRSNRPLFFGDMLRIASFLDSRVIPNTRSYPVWFFHSLEPKSFYDSREGNNQIQFFQLYQKH
jgi:hypothetical protein